MANPYEKRLLRVLDHIHDNPAGDLSLDALADVAAMSRFHWHRVFHAMTGETLAQAVRRVRMHRAACWLVQTDLPVAEIGRRVAYPNVQSFTRSFTESYGIGPGAFRRRGEARAPLSPFKPGARQMHDVKIEQRSATRVAGVTHTGPYIEIGRAFEQTFAILGSRGDMDKVHGMIGIYYDQPGSKPESELQSFAGAVVTDGFAPKEPLTVVELDGGEHAVLTFAGPYSGLRDAYDYLYGEWLPQSGRQPADRPPFENYLNTPRDTAPEDLRTEICIPLK